jgi:hypothetical protein
MTDDPEITYKFLSQAYKIVKVIALTSVSIAGVLVSVVALEIKVSSWWVDVKIPLYSVALIVVPTIIIFAIIVVVLGLLL